MANVSKIYMEQIKPAHDAALYAQQRTMGVRSALTKQMTKEPVDESATNVMSDLGPVKLPAAASSYRYAIMCLWPCNPMAMQPNTKARRMPVNADMKTA